MRILVTTRIIENATYPETRDALAQDWNPFFDQYGIMPILVPNTLADPVQYFELEPAGLLLTGGDNRGAPEAPTARDSTEQLLVARAIEIGLPILGVCRGLQTINAHFGGRVERSLTEPHVGPHDITLKDGSTVRVNSFHNNGVIREGMASQLEIFAATAAGVVEGLRHADLPITAIQWHPERPSHSPDLDRKIVENWLSQCA